ncbi:MAG: 6-carboxytetrahydropterin synthase [Bacteroidetes bacterium]|nr:6-carboxytetrahydropterin synthase [Bacteroidota bacterium]
MTTIRITKEFRFEAAHALRGYDGPCRSIHGHSYELSVTVSGTPLADKGSPKAGMVMDFGDLKKIIKKNIIDTVDHALILNKDYPVEEVQKIKEVFCNVIWVDYQPTSENMLVDFSQKIMNLLPDGVRLHSLRLRETATSFAEWVAEDNG